MDECCSILVVGTAILILPEMDKMEEYDDLINSVLLAQLVASKQMEKEPGSKWYDAYMSVLDDFWLRQLKTSKTWNVSNDADETSPDFFATALSHGALGQTRTIDTVLARIARMSDTDPAIQLLRSYMTGSAATPPTATLPPLTTVRLLVIHAVSPSLSTTSYVEFKTGETVTSNPFRGAYRPDDGVGLIQVNHARATLSETLYGPARAAIALKVRDRRASSVATVTLTEEIEP